MENKEKLRQCVIIYNNWIAENVDKPVLKALKVRPEELESFFSDLKELMNIIANDKTTIDSLDNKQRSYLKASIAYSLHSQRNDSTQRSKLTANAEIKKQLAQEAEQILKFTEAEWFRNTDTFDRPKLENFLTSQEASHADIIEATEDNESMLEPRPDDNPLQPKPPEILQNLKWIKLNWHGHWKLIIAALAIALFGVFLRKSTETQYGELFVVCNIDSAEIYLNKDLKGMTSASEVVELANLEPGDYILYVKKEGYQTFIDDMVKITTGEHTSRNISLEQTTADSELIKNKAPVIDTLPENDKGSTSFETNKVVQKDFSNLTRAVYVRDSSGKEIEGARVIITGWINEDSITDSNGKFEFAIQRPLDYSIRIRVVKNGYKSHDQFHQILSDKITISLGKIK